jgi:hypothetical protein
MKNDVSKNQDQFEFSAKENWMFVPSLWEFLVNPRFEQMGVS